MARPECGSMSDVAGQLGTKCQQLLEQQARGRQDAPLELQTAGVLTRNKCIAWPWFTRGERKRNDQEEKTSDISRSNLWGECGAVPRPTRSCSDRKPKKLELGLPVPSRPRADKASTRTDDVVLPLPCRAWEWQEHSYNYT